MVKTVEKHTQTPEIHDACGVGVVADTGGKASHRIIRLGLEALASVEHRGGVAADGRTSDGAGVKTEIQQAFFRDEYKKLTGKEVKEGNLAAGQFFLPQDETAREKCRKIVENVLTQGGLTDFVWRNVPVDPSVLGRLAEETRPHMEQLLIATPSGIDAKKFERDLFVLRRRIENKIEKEGLTGEGRDEFYVPSMSSHSIVYKGLSLAADIGKLYPDLQDERFASRYLIFHRRFSTNTAPAWKRAHPYRFLAHNGEINTLQGNVNAMPILENMFRKEFGEEEAKDILPVILSSGSDSAALDNAIEFLAHAGYSLPAIKSLLVPEAMIPGEGLPENVQAMYEYIDAITAPWDGPAMLVMADENMVLVGGDRNGLRPTRNYVVSDAGLFVAGSEDGMVQGTDAKVTKRGNLRPGEMVGVDLQNGGVLEDSALKQQAAQELKKQSADAQEKIYDLFPDNTTAPDYRHVENEDSLRLKQRLAGLTHEDIEQTIDPMVWDGKEALGSMGDDTQLAVLSGKYRPLSHFFKQRFAQVTNPPIDPIREKSFTSMTTHIGTLYDAQGRPSENKIVRLQSPILLNKEYAQIRRELEGHFIEIDCIFDIDGGEDAMEKALEEFSRQAEEAARAGKNIVLTHENVKPGFAPVPMMLATSSVHTHLLNEKLRGAASIITRPYDCHDTHACIIGMGADAVNACLTEETIAARHGQEIFDLETGEMKKRYDDRSLDACLSNYKKAIEDGVLKIMSKMGIAPVSSYRGARLFEALGLSQDLMDEYFPGVPSPVNGIGMKELQRRIAEHHKTSLDVAPYAPLSVGGRIALRKDGETHAYQSEHIYLLQEAINHKDPEEGYKIYRQYADTVRKHHEENSVHLRDLLTIENAQQPVPLTEVEPALEIVKRFATGAMSHGSISKEAHEALAVALHRLLGWSNSGEGGELPERDNTEKGSKIRQIASGRFDVSARYMTAENVKELQIKIAQGAKPGEGGQLMGHKVKGEIAALRHCEEGATLISPPPHHDIYSIEDLAQLIHDLKEINPDAQVSVKLVASHGVDTIAVGVAKAGADSIHIAGGTHGGGGTGASPQSSIHHTGMPWETALASTHKALIENGFRDKIRLTSDGSLRIGRDIMVSALMGADGYGFGLHALVALGCRLMRQCHTNKCAFGIATQDEKLREENFKGTVEGVMNMMLFIAEDVREQLAAAGFRSMEEAIGRMDCLEQTKGHEYGLSMGDILAPVDAKGNAVKCALKEGQRSEYKNPSNPDYISVDQRLLNAHGADILAGNSGTYFMNVTNQDRSIGARISGLLCRKFGERGLAADTIKLKFKGVAGQSLGIGLIQGVTIDLEGAANDGVGKSLSGGTIIVRPDDYSPMQDYTQENTIIGNSCLYGAIHGELYAAGKAGNRFAVRLSGATAVTEGAEDHACEYMTAGTVAILGEVGRNFGAGMSGGEAFVYDEKDRLKDTASEDVKDKIQTLETGSEEEQKLKNLVTRHANATGSLYAQKLLQDWDNAVKNFRYIAPQKMKIKSAPAMKI